MLDELEKLAREATQGTWSWRSFGGEPMLMSSASGKPIILDAARKGMNGATIRVRDHARCLMVPIGEVLPDHPDAAYIAALVNAAPLILAAVRAAEARIEYGCSDTCATMMRGDADCSCGHKALDAALAALKGST